MIRKIRHNYIIYMCVCVALLPLIVLRDYTPSNELRYLSIADDALRNHTFFTFYNHGEVYADKPPLYFWALMLCRWLAGGYHMWMLALFSLLPAVGVVAVMDRWVAGEADLSHRRLAALMLFTSGLFLGTSFILRMDMLMTLFIVLALREFWRMYCDEGGRRSRWLFPVYLFLALFAKGPFGLLIPFCATTVFLLLSRQTARFARFWGWRTWAVLGALCVCWFIGVYAEGGRGYLDNLLVHQTVGRAVNSFHHKRAFYYYLVHVWYCAAPWSLLAACTLVVSQRKTFVKSSLLCFFQTVAIVTFVLLSCVSAKLQVYLLPAIPFFVYPVALLLPRLGRPWWLRLSVAVPAVAFAAVLPLLPMVATWEEVQAWGGMWVYGAAAAFTLTGVVALWLLSGGKDVERAIRCMCAGLLLAVFAAGWAMPKLNSRLGYAELCGEAKTMSRVCGVADIRTWDLPRTEGMDVYLGVPVKVLPSDVVPSADKGHPYILVTRRSNLPKLGGLRRGTVVGEYAVVPFLK